MTAPSTQELLRDLIYKLAPSIVLAGVHLYVVARAAGDGRYDLEPAPRVLHGPRLRVEQWAAPGVEAGLTLGDELAIVFLNNDERYPAIVAHVPLRRTTPASLRVDCSGTLRMGASASLIHLATGSDLMAPGTETGRVVRFGDAVSVGSSVGPIQSTSGVVSKVRAI